MKLLIDLDVFDPEQLEKFKQLRSDIVALEDQRDEIVHRVWWKSLESPEVVKGILDKRRQVLEPVERTASDIDMLAKFINIQNFKLTRFLVDESERRIGRE